jgi:hypothetical protein
MRDACKAETRVRPREGEIMSELLSSVIEHALEIALYVSTAAVALLCLATGLAGLLGSRHAHA